jgi:ABC-type uncharacterized transport system ATPase component
MSDSTDNARGPERIWALHNYVAGMTNILSGHIMLEPTEIAETTEYRRADLAADRIEELEAKLAKAVETLEKLARLGNGDRYGNSDGNMIARTTLAELKGEKP